MAINSYDVVKGSPPWWKQRTSMELYGILILLVAIFTIIALIVALILAAQHSIDKRPEDEICNTPNCVEAAAKVLKNMDRSVDPCDDFYQFACGNFLRERMIPDDKSTVDLWQDVYDLVRNQLRIIFEEPSTTNEIKPFTIVKKFYNMCLDTDSLEDVTVVNKLVRDLGGWPVVEGYAWDENSFNWQNSDYKFRAVGLNMEMFIQTDILVDLENASRYVISLNEPGFPVDRDDLLNGLDDEIVKAYYNYAVDIAVLFGANRVIAEYDMKHMVEFNIQLANITLTHVEHRDQETSCQTMTVLQLQRRYPPINWLEYLNKIVGLPNQSVTNNQKVNIRSPKYLSKIGYLLEKTSKRTQANYAIFKALRAIEPYLPTAMRDCDQAFSTAQYGVAARKPRWQECIDETIWKFKIATGALYVRRFFKEETKQVITEMISDIRNGVIKILEDTEWMMYKPTKKKTIEKASAIQSQVAYPDEFLDDKKLEDYYTELPVDYDNIIQFSGNISIFQNNKRIRRLGELVNKTDWRTRELVLNAKAFYDPQENSLQLPAAVLQDFFFNTDHLYAMNFGSIGFIIGHEITHGFDDKGRNYDKDGNLAKWWDPDTIETFTKNTECIIEQYSNYTVSEIGKNLNGKLTQGENIADNVGIKEAYLAYNAWVQRNGLEPKLPGLNYTAKQLFWISAANCWCSKERKEYLRSFSAHFHSLPRFRILGAFSNSDYFSRDFQCPLGSKMNPIRKCQVW